MRETMRVVCLLIIYPVGCFLVCFFFNDTATTEIYTLSLHDALPICRGDVIEAENQLQRAQAAVKVAKERISLSNSTYQTRLAQLGAIANKKGLITVTAPISGQVELIDRKSTRLNSSHMSESRMPSSA